MSEALGASTSLELFSRDGMKGSLFCGLHAPVDRPAVGACLYLHPFAEEMNKSRRMAALQARALASSGWMVMQQDCFGCGDSMADFGAADWKCWVEDAVSAARWLSERSGQAVWLWGLRAGCLLASAAAQFLSDCSGMIFWQPVVSGQQHLRQFLRLKLAGDRLAGGINGGAQKGLRDVLLSGEAVEVAGYTISSRLAAGLDAARLVPPTQPGIVGWFEVSGAAQPSLATSSLSTIEDWRTAGWQVEARPIAGSSFWQTQEIELAPALVAATLEFSGRYA